jgi:hypothetical protein
MSNISTTNVSYLKTLQEWLQSQGEILVLIRFPYAAGSKSFEFFTSFHKLSERLRELPRRTSIIAFKESQLPIRGVVDDAFIQTCVNQIPEGSEYLITETILTTAGRRSWFHDGGGESHAELREDLENSRGRPVAVGHYPPWLEDNENVVSAIVPEEDGTVKRAAY